MSGLYEALGTWLRDPMVRMPLFALLFWIVGLVVARLVVGGLARVAAQHLDAQRVTSGRRIAFYGLAILVTLAALHRGGIDMSVFFGAAGILTVAFGFASQTSMSNLISGVFLIGERSFTVGDWITVGSATGEVLSIDLLSVKLRTPENLFVRVPNETLIKTDIVNLSRFPIRRVEIDFRVEYETDLAALAQLLEGIVHELPECLLEPKTHFFVQDFTDAAVWVKFRFWTRREVFLEARATVQALAQERLAAAGIRQPTQRLRMERPAALDAAMESPPDVS
ncbi:MAG: mechanosensitive ion channel family protein [Sandaracinaceae bacterium]|nr:mechanosensitive ion channel family protein [Sandaracinaceae bacterium]MBP7683704.1 mechanosensitive ion channel family protein [Deltaproteobacteria bacterium]MBK7156929.1 mechanosensitive ion channel family protein [Sandaracinaceae bacterium]MBK7776045.1 mechanosensitive ion channel family protein [Sandaracinaceae bacterium]MBK8407880.1 mechanosensitive ion channel family protein [Sandaracinaceae bacterium]